MLASLILTSSIILVFVVFIWFLYLINHNPSIIDVGWSIGVFLAGTSFLLSQIGMSFHSIKLLVIWSLLLLWALRLSGFLFITRIIKQKHDPRYELISENWKVSKKFGFLMNYLLQGFLMLLIASPFLYIANLSTHGFVILDFVACALVLLGILGESIADLQLFQFKIKAKKGGVCKIGLWQYSRHPNYFFEWLVWIGFALFGLSAPYGLLSLLSPLLLLGIFIFVTGPITEKSSIRSKGELYREYQRKTSMFVPWFGKK